MNSIKVFVHRADPLRGEPPDAAIYVERELPLTVTREQHESRLLLESPDSLAKLYDNDAKALVDALCGSLPQGTVDRVVVRLLERKLSLYRGTIGGG